MHRRRMSQFSVALTALTLLTLGLPAEAQVRVETPTRDFPGIPAYARINTIYDEVFHTQAWAAIPFYRQPDCVPKEFNLLEFFDAPGAFACPMTVKGFEFWEKAWEKVPPPQTAIPIMTKLQGLGAVPIWFVAWPELREAIADNRLTIGELAAMKSLQRGAATFFEEKLFLASLEPIPGDHQLFSLDLVAYGRLSDGRSFDFLISEKRTAEEEHRSVSIRFQ